MNFSGGDFVGYAIGFYVFIKAIKLCIKREGFFSGITKDLNEVIEKEKKKERDNDRTDKEG